MVFLGRFDSLIVGGGSAARKNIGSPCDRDCYSPRPPQIFWILFFFGLDLSLLFFCGALTQSFEEGKEESAGLCIHSNTCSTGLNIYLRDEGI